MITRLSRPRHFWFKFLLTLGGLLGLLLLIQTVVTYRYVERSMMRDEAQREAGRRVISIDRAARLTRARDAKALTPVIHELVHEAPQTIDWIRIVDADGRTLAESEPVEGAPQVTRERLAQLGGRGRGGADGGGPGRGGANVIEHGDVLVVLSPVRIGSPGREFVETAVFLKGISGHFGVLRQNLIIGTTAAFALLAAVIVIGLRFPNYLKSKHVEEELALARRVQLDLFPLSDSLAHKVNFAARCIPALEVGGDLYDVFETEEGEIALVLGDVSGKGLPAALLMGVVQGAVRASTHPHAAERLNHLLCLKTARERFVSLFWCTFNPRTRILRYVNAGHLPPLLVRQGPAGPEFKCLDEGGPVLGLLPAAHYAPSEVTIQDDDLLIVYSDGILEAADAGDRDFGEEGVRRSVVTHWKQSPEAICEAILADVKTHLGKGEPQDDQTLLVARLAGAVQVAEARA